MKLSREVIYTMLALVIAGALLHPIGMRPYVTEGPRKLYDFIQALPQGSIVWMGFDYYASTTAECTPNAEAILTHLFRRNLRVVITENIPDSVAISSDITHRLAAAMGKQYGVDYINLGYQAGNQLFLKQAAENFHATFRTDVLGNPLDSLPLGRAIHSARDVKLVMTVTDNQTFEYFVQIVHTEFKTPIAGAMTAVMVPGEAVYLNSGQALAILGGLRGAAEYEALMGIMGFGTRGLDAQSFAHIFIVLLIIVSNIDYFRTRGRRWSR